jgi:TPR repeat protein
VDGKSFDTSRINGREIEDWVYPFMMRRVKWEGIFEELAKATGSENYTILFSGSEDALQALKEACPKQVIITTQTNTTTSPLTPEQKKGEELEQLACRYDTGDGMLPDIRKSFQLRKQSSALGYAPSQKKLGDHYYYAIAVKRDYTEAANWYREAAKQGNADAQCMLGFCYHNAKGVAKNEAEAIQWFKKAAEQNHITAQYMAGSLYHYGTGIKKNDVDAVKWMRKSAEQGDSSAQYLLGSWYYYGDGVTKDYGEALQWLKKAAEQGDTDAEALAKLCPKVGDYYYPVKNDTAEDVVSPAPVQDKKVQHEVQKEATPSMDAAQLHTNPEKPTSREAEGIDFDFEEPLDVTYIPENHRDFYSPHDSQYLNPYRDNRKKNFLYSLFFYIHPDGLKKMISILGNVHQFTKSDSIEKTGVEYYNDLVKCYGLDASKSTEAKRADLAKQITNTLCKNTDVIKKSLEQTHNMVEHMPEDEEYAEARKILLPLNGKLQVLIREISNDFQNSKDKIFSYFSETENLKGDSCAIKAIHFMLDVIEEEFDDDVEEYESESKSASLKGTVAGVAGGFLGGILGGAIAYKYADNLDNDVEEMRLRIIHDYAKNVETVIRYAAVILAIDSIYDIAVDWIIDDVDFDDECDNFFDKI